MGEPYTGRLHVRRKGVPPLHYAPNASALAAPGYSRSVGPAGEGQKERLLQRPAGGATKRGLAAVFDGLKPLRDADNLGYILLQFPPWLLRSRENVEHILHCADVLLDYTV